MECHLRGGPPSAQRSAGVDCGGVALIGEEALSVCAVGPGGYGTRWW
jgi:hypothetical protein